MLVDSIQIYSSQRYSFILKTNQPVNNYWIRANPDIGTTGFANAINSAILRYAGAPDAEPTTTQSTSVIPLVETNLHPLVNTGVPGLPFPGGADVNINLNLTVNLTSTRFFVNGVSFVPPTVPVLLQVLSGAKTAQELLPPGSVYVLPRNKVIEVSIPGGVIGGPVSSWLNSEMREVLIFHIASFPLARS